MLSPQLEQHLELLEEESRIESDQSERQLNESTDDSPSPTAVIATAKNWFSRNLEVYERCVTQITVIAIVVVLLHRGNELNDSEQHILYAFPIGLATFSLGLFVSRRRESTNNKQSCYMVNRSVRECRLRLSSLLGSIGAPPLESIEIESASQHSRIVPQLQVTLLEEFVQIHLQLMRTIDEALTVLRTATSMSLGLGIQANRGVERVEHAAVGRTLRSRSSKKTTTEVLLSLPTLRRLLSHILKHDRELLRSFDIVDTANKDVDPNDVSSEIVTISSLSSMRHEVVELLSWIASCYSSGVSLAGSDTSKLYQSMSFAEEAQAHLLASLSPFENQTEKIISPLQKLLASLQRQVYALQVAILGCQDTLDGDDWNPDSTKAAECWKQISQLSTALNGIIQKVDCEFFHARVDVSIMCSSEADAAQSAKRPMEAAGEFIIDGSHPDGSTAQPKSIDQKDRTFIFSGNGVVRPKPKHERSSVPLHDSQRPIESFSPFEAQMLIQELQSHLNSMPQVDEVHVVGSVSSAASTDGGNANKVGADGPNTARTDVDGLNGLVLGELRGSILKFSTADESLQWEVNSSSS